MQVAATAGQNKRRLSINAADQNEEDIVHAAKRQVALVRVETELADARGELALVHSKREGELAVAHSKTNRALALAHAEAAGEILAVLAAPVQGLATAPATVQLLQTIKQNVVVRVGSMLETSMCSPLPALPPTSAVPGPYAVKVLTVNEQAQRLTVQMYANAIGLPAGEQTEAKLKKVTLARVVA